MNAGDQVFVLVGGFRDGAAGPFTLQVQSIAGPVGSPVPSPGKTP